MSNPLKQFALHKIIDFEIAGIDLSLTNGAAIMLLIPTVIYGFFYFALNTQNKENSRIQIAAEMIYEVTLDVLRQNVGKEAKKYQALIFTFFIFILLCNLIGMLPYSYTATSHIAITSMLSAGIFFMVNIVGFKIHNISFTKIFLPSGTPLWLAPFMIIIELFAFFARPFSLSLRLLANMVAGHVLLKVIAGFAVTLSIIFKIFPIPVMVVLTGFEIFVAILQAYIFAVLSCLYLSDSINLH